MSKNYLFIVEGEVTEKEILSKILVNYGFKKINDAGRLKFSANSNTADFILKHLNSTANEDQIIIVQGPQTRIRCWLNDFDAKTSDFERFFDGIETSFAGVFIIYDVDHTTSDELEKMFNLYPDETTGLLLVNSPCIEVLGDTNRTDDLKAESLTKDYKAKLNIRYDKEHHTNVKDYIIKNFDSLILYFIDKNVKDSKSTNVLDHPQFVISEINKYNIRPYFEGNKEMCYYRYFTTVMYVAIAYMLGKTKEFDNAEAVKQIFIDRLNSKQINPSS